MTELAIHPTAARFPPLGDEELSQLADHIKAHGLQQPIVVTADGKTLIDGINRHRACKKAGVKPTFRKLPKNYTDADIIRFIIGANIHRRDLSPGQKGALVLEAEGDLEAAAAKQRQRQAGKQFGRGQNSSASRDAKLSDKTSEKLATRAGVGSKTIDRAKAVRTYSPNLFERVISGTLSLNDAYKQVQAAKKSEREKQVKPAPSKTHLMLKTHVGDDVPYPLPKGKATFNQTNDQVSWAAWTWNPVTGCLHGCPYCYANELANRPSYADAYPVKFTPLFHHERLDAPANTSVPKEAKADPRLGRVFVCSMADLYGKWVPDEWIEKVHASCIANGHWEYLMLTKFPRRYVGLKLPPTAWLGTSVDEQKRVRLAEEAFRAIEGVRVRWLSLEPLLAPLEFSDLSMFDWVVIGSQSATEQPDGAVPAFAPPFEWVARLTDQAREAGCRIYQKPNLLGVPDPQHAGMQLIQEEPEISPIDRAQAEMFDEAAE